MVNYNFNRLCFAQSHEYNRLCECRIYTYIHTYLYVCPPKSHVHTTLIIIALGFECADFSTITVDLMLWQRDLVGWYVCMCSSICLYLILRG